MDRYSLKRVSGPAQEPVTVAQAKSHLNVTHSDDDSLITALVAAAREACEVETGRCFVWSTWELKLDAFPYRGHQEIRLPRPPLVRVNSIHYVDAAGELQELGSDNWQVDGDSEPARIRPAPDKSWPATKFQMNAVIVSYVAGYPYSDAGSPADYAANVPQGLNAALKLMLGHLYENRSSVNIGNIVAELPMSAKWLLWHHKVIDFTLTA